VPAKADGGFSPHRRDTGTGTLFSSEGVEVCDLESLRHLENCIASTSVLDSYDSSYKGSLVNALALGADEGRSRLR
jgi:hypothetical protein